MDREKTKSTHKRLLNTSTKEKVKEVKEVKEVKDVKTSVKNDDKPVRKNFTSIKEMQQVDPTYNQFSVLSNVN
jgi:hypothetical protein